jgi:N-methylhydantoinase B/oxoprolinase/acetone carboxylase alpha subunit
MPVHLGSMGESIKTVMRENAGKMRAGDVFMLNDPYNGGTHLPDVTVITPVFDEAAQHPVLRRLAATMRTSAAPRRARCRRIRA